MTLGILNKKKTLFVLVDVQERFVPVMHEMDRAMKNINILCKASNILGIPLVVTEQYPKGLGKTHEKVDLPANVIKVEKTHFSCFGCEAFAQEIKKIDPKAIVLFGVEAHVCILKTALDAAAKGIEVHVVADAITSRKPENKKIAIKRLRQSGAFIVSTEMILFQLLDKAGTEEFKQISELVK